MNIKPEEDYVHIFRQWLMFHTVNQLLPVVNYSNPLALSSGNRYLKPEVGYDLSLELVDF